METNIQKWGNSLGVRLPAALTNSKSLKAGSRVLVTETEKGLAIEVVKKPVMKLESLLAKIKPANLHQESDWGNSVGNEVW